MARRRPGVNARVAPPYFVKIKPSAGSVWHREALSAFPVEISDAVSPMARVARQLSVKRAVEFRGVVAKFEANAQLLSGAPDQLTRSVHSAVFRKGKEELAWKQNVGIKRQLGTRLGDIDNRAFMLPCAVYRNDGRFPVHPPTNTLSLIMKHATVTGGSRIGGKLRFPMAMATIAQRGQTGWRAHVILV
jgi:hypothetical protein